LYERISRARFVDAVAPGDASTEPPACGRTTANGIAARKTTLRFGQSFTVHLRAATFAKRVNDDAAALALIESYTTVVLDVDAATIEGLRRP